jgi:2-C-methyl-D-erythritol 4-phosphate cytidylyltransferase
VAGGSGKRMKSGVPKQFMLIQGIPVLMHTINVFHEYDPGSRIRVVLPENQIEVWKRLCIDYKFNIEHEISPGGETRFHSVQKNIWDIPDDALVAIHDGVRPLVSQGTIDRCFRSAEKLGNAVPCVEIPETMRKLEKSGTAQVDRTAFRLIQTPQIFSGHILKEAYHQPYEEYFTDDAGVVESAGFEIFLVEGNSENIKITIEKDLIIAAALLKNS